MGFTEEQLVAELPGLLRYARLLTRDAQGAEDLVQETVVRALERAAQFRGRVGCHLVAPDHVHPVRRRDPCATPEPVDEEALVDAVEADWRDDAYTVTAEVVPERAERREELLDALLRLPVPYRTAIVLHDVEGLTASAVAEVQQVSLSAAKQRIRRGREMLVSALAGGAERRAALAGVPLNCWDARSRIDDYLRRTRRGGAPSARAASRRLSHLPGVVREHRRCAVGPGWPARPGLGHPRLPRRARPRRTGCPLTGVGGPA